MDRDIQDYSWDRGIVSHMMISGIYHLVLYRYFRNGRVYLRAMKGDATLGWQMTLNHDKAYRFTYPAHALAAINEYCFKYGDDTKNFRVMKVTEEQIVL
jgi:hypothetical protein